MLIEAREGVIRQNLAVVEARKREPQGENIAAAGGTYGHLIE
jgi:hypothetical protein